MTLHRNMGSLQKAQLYLMSSRDPERLAKIRSGRLKVEHDELQAVIAEDAQAMAEWDPYYDGIMDHG